MKNYKITASKLERLDLCPGSLRAEEGLPDRVSALGESGQRVHRALRHSFDPTPAGWVPSPLTGDEEKIVFEYQREGLFLITERATQPITAHVEKRIEDDDGYSGQPDLVVLWTTAEKQKRALVLDWKSGWLEQEASPRNLQLRGYAVLVHRKYKVDDILVALLQRNAPTEITQYNAEDLARARGEILEIIARARADNAPRFPGERQCRYCRAIGVCPEARALAPEILGAVMPVEVPLAAIDRKTVEAIVPRLTGEQLAYIRQRKAVIEWVIEAVDGEIRTRLEANPASVPGWTLRDGATRREVTDIMVAYDRLKDHIGPREFSECCRVNLGAIETAFRESEGCTGAQAKQAVNERLAAVIVEKQNRPSIVKAKA